MSDLVTQLQENPLLIEELPAMRICRYRGKWVALDHRRLYACRQALGDTATVLFEVSAITDEFYTKLDTVPRQTIEHRHRTPGERRRWRQRVQA